MMSIFVSEISTEIGMKIDVGCITQTIITTAISLRIVSHYTRFDYLSVSDIIGLSLVIHINCLFVKNEPNRSQSYFSF